MLIQQNLILIINWFLTCRHSPCDLCTSLNERTGCPASAVIPLLFHSLHRRKSGIPAAKEGSPLIISGKNSENSGALARKGRSERSAIAALQGLTSELERGMQRLEAGYPDHPDAVLQPTGEICCRLGQLQSSTRL